MNLDSSQWNEITPTEFRSDMKRYTQSSIYEQDYYEHVKRIEREGGSFFTPRPKFNAPNLTFLMWDEDRIGMKNIADLNPSDKRIPIIRSYMVSISRKEKIDSIL